MDPDLDRLLDIPDPYADARHHVPPPVVHQDFPASATRAGMHRLRISALGCALLYEGGVLALAGLRPDLSSLPPAILGVGTVAPLASAMLALILAERTGKSGVGSAGLRVAAGLLVPLGLFGLSTFLSAHGAIVLSGRAYWSATAMCVAATTVLATGPLVLAIISFRRAFASAAAWRTAALGVACGAVAAAAMHLRCAVEGQLHLFLGHGAALVVAGVVGLSLARFTRC